MNNSNSSADFLRLSTEIVFTCCPILLIKEESSRRFLPFNFDSNLFIEFLCFIKEQDISVAVENLSGGMIIGLD